jgi:hypothetical protein
MACQTVPQTEKTGCRVMPLATAPYRDIRANMEQMSAPAGLDHYGRGGLGHGWHPLDHG